MTFADAAFADEERLSDRLAQKVDRTWLQPSLHISCEGMPPLCMILPSIMMAGVALTPWCLISAEFPELVINIALAQAVGHLAAMQSRQHVRNQPHERASAPSACQVGRGCGLCSGHKSRGQPGVGAVAQATSGEWFEWRNRPRQCNVA